MDFEKLLGMVVLLWLISSVLLMAGLIRRGRRLTTLLATRHPETYEMLGRPQPGFLHSERRESFSRFISRRAYENIGDPVLSDRFEEYKRAQARLLTAILVSLVLVVLLMSSMHYFV